MSNSFNKDLVVELVKNILDCNRCLICDKLEGSRLRHACGHSACEECILNSDCVLCLTPPQAKEYHRPVHDNPLSTRISNASKLLNAFQNAFNIDVFKRHRVSEQLKIEKELFPKCIQAPAKYTNKRKSLYISENNKENRSSFFAGEQISPLKNLKMQNSKYVQQWLDRNEKAISENKPRKPFTDLKDNNQSLHRNPNIQVKKRVDLMLENVHTNSGNITKREANRKRNHFKSTFSVVNSQPLLDNYLKPVDINKPSEYTLNKKQKLDSETTNFLVQNVLNKTDEDESGIVMDDGPIVIDDSQSQIINKDQLAWLDVLKASENETFDPTPSERFQSSNIVKYPSNTENVSTKLMESDKSDVGKVPFFKKGSLSELCHFCNMREKNNELLNKSNGKCRDISITIESKSFTTIITMSNSETQSHSKGLKQSVPVQTDIQGVENIMDDPMKLSLCGNNVNPIKKIERLSQDLFTAEAKDCPQNIFDKSFAKVSEQEQQNEHKEAKILIIADSDSDDGINLSSTIQVTADVHRSSDQFDCEVLAEIGQSEILQRTKRAGRGVTPTSTDSSEKENYDPNRAKRVKLGKKRATKKNKKKHNVIPVIV